MIPGLQTKGIFCLHCNIEPERILVGQLWLRDFDLVGKEVSLIESDGTDRYLVQIPNLTSSPAENVELKRVTL